MTTKKNSNTDKKVFKFDGIRALTLMHRFDCKEKLMEYFNKVSKDRIATKITLELEDNPIPIVICLYTETKEVRDERD